MAVTRRWIKVKTEFRGIHCWPECPYEEVAFLRDPHRHTFKVEVKIEVEHNDRGIEFFMFQHDVDREIAKLYGTGDLYCHYDGTDEEQWSLTKQEIKEKVEPISLKYIEPYKLGRKSCEEIAEDIFGALSDKYCNRHMGISVSEDGEVAAEIEFEPESNN